VKMRFRASELGAEVEKSSARGDQRGYHWPELQRPKLGEARHSQASTVTGAVTLRLRKDVFPL
jgi:hypothetical protein